MYRLVLYILIAYIVIAIIEALFGLLSFSPLSILVSAIAFLIVCLLSNKILAKIFKAPTSIESSYITALILTSIVTPANNQNSLLVIALIGIIAMTSKYLIAVRHKHIFNPAAFAVVISGIFFSNPASWWIGTVSLAPVTIIGGFLIVKKLRFFEFVSIFIASFLLLTFITAILNKSDEFVVLSQTLIYSSLIFMGTVMLTEPQTLPPKKVYRNIYASIVGILSIYILPEIALLIGNIFSFLVSLKRKLTPELVEKNKLASNIWEFVFKSQKKLDFVPGQYMEWTLSHQNTDSRGNRRFFTIASSPTEENLKLGIRFEEKGSSFKRALFESEKNKTIVAGNLSGDFILPKNKQKLAFIAGGIGITPFRSIIKYLSDRKEVKDIILIYSNSEEKEIVYKDLFDEGKMIGLKPFYTLTNNENMPTSWKGEKGRIDGNKIMRLIPDFKERLFYISGPQPFVQAMKRTLVELRVSRRQIKTDYFPGYA